MISLTMRYSNLSVTLCLSCLVFISCSGKSGKDLQTQTPKASWTVVQTESDTLMSIGGFSGPEAVRFDEEFDVYYVSNFNGRGGDRDSNGFISKLAPDGRVLDLKYMQGTDEFPLHAPRGMFIDGNLFVADADGVHIFNRADGSHAGFIDFSAFEPGFLNDITKGTDGKLYVTDTGGSAKKVYSIDDGKVEIAFADLPARPNGITLHPGSGKLVLAPWGGSRTFVKIDPATGAVETDEHASGGRFDGIEFYTDRAIVASQDDQSIYVHDKDGFRPFISVPGRPADIAIDAKRHRILVPYVALDRVDVWALPVK